MASMQTLILEIIARDKNASAAFDSLRRSIDNSSTAADKNTKALQANQQAQTSAMGAAAGVGLAFSAMTSPIASAGAGILAYGTIAAPTILKVKTALTGPGGLTAAWGTLDNRQRNMALGIQALSGRYHDLATAMEPRVAQTFGTALGIVNSALGPFSQLAGNAGTALEQFLIQFAHQGGLNQFITFMAHEAGPAIKLLGTDITNIAHSVFALLQSWGGLGLAELKLVTGVITGITGSLTWLATHAPGITSAAIALGGIALALSKLGLASKVLEITGIASIAGQMTGFAAATRGATLAEKGLLATTTALEAVSPWAWVAAGAAALAFLADKIVTSKTQVQSLIGEMAKADGATGLNVAGYRRLSDALGKASTDYGTLIQNVSLAGVKYGGLQHDTTQLTDASSAAAAMASNLAGSFQSLADKYGITSDQAMGLIAHAGEVNDILKAGGKITPQVAKALDDYAKSNRRAQGPSSQLAADIADYSNKTLTATTRTKALSDALNQFFNPAVTADQAVITLKNDQVALAAALAASGGKTGLLTQKQRDARGAFDTYINDVATAAQKAFDATGKTSSYNDMIKRSLPGLLAAAGHNKALRDEIQKLIDTERGLHTERVSIFVKGIGNWSVGTGQAPGTTTAGGRGGGAGTGAAGMLVRGGIPGRDSVPIMAMPGEVLVPTNMVAAGAVDHLRGRLPGFASGGVVGSYRDGIGGLSPWLVQENAATLKAIEQSTANAIFAAIRQGPPGMGLGGQNLGGGVSRWAPVILAALGLLGQSSGWLGPVEGRMARESGGNPTIVNKWDSNWAAGTPSVGLMQVIGPTYAAYAGAFRNTGPFEYGVSVAPLANIYAGLNYAIHRYGSLGVMSAPGGYDEGGWLPPGVSVAVNGTGKAERVGGGGNVVISGPIHIHMPPGSDGKAIVEALQNYARRNGAIRLKVRS